MSNANSISRNWEIFTRYCEGEEIAKLAAAYELSTKRIRNIITEKLPSDKKPRRTPARANICFDCKNACGGCSWSARFEPVPGWTATPTRFKYFDKAKNTKWTDTFHITECPEFIRG